MAWQDFAISGHKAKVGWSGDSEEQFVTYAVVAVAAVLAAE
jgi:hypothetical protein